MVSVSPPPLSAVESPDVANREVTIRFVSARVLVFACTLSPVFNQVLLASAQLQLERHLQKINFGGHLTSATIPLIETMSLTECFVASSLHPRLPTSKA